MGRDVVTTCSLPVFWAPEPAVLLRFAFIPAGEAAGLLLGQLLLSRVEPPGWGDAAGSLFPAGLLLQSPQRLEDPV